MLTLKDLVELLKITTRVDCARFSDLLSSQCCCYSTTRFRAWIWWFSLMWLLRLYDCWLLRNYWFYIFDCWWLSFVDSLYNTSSCSNRCELIRICLTIRQIWSKVRWWWRWRCRWRRWRRLRRARSRRRLRRNRRNLDSSWAATILLIELISGYCSIIIRARAIHLCDGLLSRANSRW